MILFVLTIAFLIYSIILHDKVRNLYKDMSERMKKIQYIVTENKQCPYCKHVGYIHFFVYKPYVDQDFNANILKCNDCGKVFPQYFVVNVK